MLPLYAGKHSRLLVEGHLSIARAPTGKEGAQSRRACVRVCILAGWKTLTPSIRKDAYGGREGDARPTRPTSCFLLPMRYPVAITT